jgi:hypothetical protein
LSAGAERPDSHFRMFGSERSPTYILVNTGKFRIVEACPFDTGIIQLKSEWTYQVQVCASICTQTYDVARIRWNLGLVKYDIQHLKQSLTL